MPRDKMPQLKSDKMPQKETKCHKNQISGGRQNATGLRQNATKKDKMPQKGTKCHNNQIMWVRQNATDLRQNATKRDKMPQAQRGNVWNGDKMPPLVK